MIRKATNADATAIVAIYNQAIDAGFQTAFTERQTVAERTEWFAEHSNPLFPIFVFEQNKHIAGWLSVGPYRSGRAALKYTAELSYFIHNEYRKQGIAGKLMEWAINECSKLGYKTLLAIILDKNEASVSLVKKFAFEQWGVLPDVADFDGIKCGHLYYGLKL